MNYEFYKVLFFLKVIMETIIFRRVIRFSIDFTLTRITLANLLMNNIYSFFITNKHCLCYTLSLLINHMFQVISGQTILI